MMVPSILYWCKCLQEKNHYYELIWEKGVHGPPYVAGLQHLAVQLVGKAHGSSNPAYGGLHILHLSSAC